MKIIPTLIFPLIDSKEVSSPEFSLNVSSNSPGKLEYRSSNESVAIVNEYGFVSTICAGQTDIYVKQLETEEFESIEICRTLYVNKSNQEIIIEELVDGKFTKISSISKPLGNFFDVKITLNSLKNFEINSTNSATFDILKINDNIYRIFPKRIGTNLLLIYANGDSCYNDLYQFLEVEIIQKFPTIAIDLKLSVFTQSFKHDALDEFSLITSNSGQQQLDNSLILQTTLDSNIGEGYFRNIGITNTHPENLINNIHSYIQNCCNVFETWKKLL